MITIAQARSYYRNDAAHDFDHVLRVLANARQIARTEPANLQILETAVLLHDIARADQARTGRDHAAEGARRARAILRDAPPHFVDAVCHAIAAHRFRVDNPPQTIEAKILYDADKLDAIGAVGVARAFAFSGHHNQPLWAEDESGLHSPWQEYRRKLVKIRDKLLTEAGRRLAQQRHDFMVQFFAQLQAEIRGER
ncbi:MAG: HD domain-containing protein [Caldilineae bacterium]|nr:MAG: HD domain-containing protein [Caldilineae bacterium]